MYDGGRLDKDNIQELNNLRDRISNEYAIGKINKEQYDRLGEEISVSYREIFAGEINSK